MEWHQSSVHTAPAPAQHAAAQLANAALEASLLLLPAMPHKLADTQEKVLSWITKC